MDAIRTSYAEAMEDADAAYFNEYFGELMPENLRLAADETQVIGTSAFERGSYQLYGALRAGGKPADCASDALARARNITHV
jgi:hypothetical protein